MASSFCHAYLRAAAVGTAYVGFGTSFIDVDGDGWEDLVIANGHVIRKAPNLRQRPLLLRNEGNARFTGATPLGGPYFQTAHRGRGLAVGDLDNDGRPDLVITNANEPVVLLRNEAPPRHWIGIDLVAEGHRDLVGARLVLEVDGVRRTRFVKNGSSYFSSNDRRILIGWVTGPQSATHPHPADGRTQTWAATRS